MTAWLSSSPSWADTEDRNGQHFPQESNPPHSTISCSSAGGLCAREVERYAPARDYVRDYTVSYFSANVYILIDWNSDYNFSARTTSVFHRKCFTLPVRCSTTVAQILPSYPHTNSSKRDPAHTETLATITFIYHSCFAQYVHTRFRFQWYLSPKQSEKEIVMTFIVL